MRKFMTFLCTLASIALLVALFVVSVQLVVMNRSFYTLEYNKMDTARRLGVTQSVLDRTTEDLLDYLEGDDIDLSEVKVDIGGKSVRAFSSDDVAHMRDVLDLYNGAKTVRNVAILFVLFVFLLTLLALRKERMAVYARGYILGMSIVAALLLVLGVWMAIDFNAFWDFFHRVFFRNLLWRMDPATSFMINMFPGQFWYDVCMRVLSYFGVVSGGLLLMCIVVFVVRAHRRNTPMLVKDGEKANPAARDDGMTPPWQS